MPGTFGNNLCIFLLCILGELGGLLGASLGASFLTFIELADFLATRFLRRLEKKRGEIIRVASVGNEGPSS